MSTPAAEYPIVINQHQTFRWSFTLKDAAGDPLDLTGSVARMQVRATVEDETPVLDLDSGTPTADGTITLGDEAGTVLIEVPDTVTALLDYQGGVYDFVIEDELGVSTRWLKGPAELDRGVTR